MSFDELIFERGTRTVLGGWYQKVKTLLSNDQIQYRLPGQIHADRTPGMMACQTRWPSLVECAVACTDAIRTIPDLTPCERGSEIGHAVLRCPGDGGTARSTSTQAFPEGPRSPKSRPRGTFPPSVGWDDIGCVARPGDAPNRVGLEQEGGARGESRTPTPFRAPDPKVAAARHESRLYVSSCVVWCRPVSPGVVPS